MKPAMRQTNFFGRSWTIDSSISDPSPDYLDLLDHFYDALADKHRSPITFRV